MGHAEPYCHCRPHSPKMIVPCYTCPNCGELRNDAPPCTHVALLKEARDVVASLVVVDDNAMLGVFPAIDRARALLDKLPKEDV